MLVVVYRRFGTSYLSHLQEKKQLDDCLTLKHATDNDLDSYQYKLRKTPEERRTQL
jgi:hypothetical protein